MQHSHHAAQRKTPGSSAIAARAFAEKTVGANWQDSDRAQELLDRLEIADLRGVKAYGVLSSDRVVWTGRTGLGVYNLIDLEAMRLAAIEATLGDFNAVYAEGGQAAGELYLIAMNDFTEVQDLLQAKFGPAQLDRVVA